MSPRPSPATLMGWTPVLLGAGAVLFTLFHHLSSTPGAGLTPGPEGQAAPDTAAAPASQPVRLEALLEWSLFGKADGDGSIPADAASADGSPDIVLPEDDENTVLPPATLDLKVQGIAYSRDRSRAYAIMEIEGAPPQEYRPGDTLKDGVQLRSIRPLEVVILNQGRLEAAALPVSPSPMTAEEDSTTIQGESPQGGPAPFSILGGDRPPGNWRRLDSLRGAQQ